MNTFERSRSIPRYEMNTSGSQKKGKEKIRMRPKKEEVKHRKFFLSIEPHY
jgi:hypothetical protein